MDGDEGDGSDDCDNSQEHDDDELSGSVSGFRRGLGDAHRVDEGVRDEEEELHGIPNHGSKIRVAESRLGKVHLINMGLAGVVA